MDESFVVSLARPQPVPGGGAASAYAASVGLALLEKIVRLEMQRGGAPVERNLMWKDLLSKVVASAWACERLRDEDGEAYLRWAALRVSGDDVNAIDAALKEAIACPINIVKRVQGALECVIETGRYSKRLLLSDLLVVCEVLNGAGKGAAHIASANLRWLADAAGREDLARLLAHWTTLAEQSYNGAREGLLHELNASPGDGSGRD